ncbi:MAG: hypothetical protein WAM14_00565 [Candidatus Nitrosopolaris sp.]
MSALGVVKMTLTLLTKKWILKGQKKDDTETNKCGCCGGKKPKESTYCWRCLEAWEGFHEKILGENKNETPLQMYTHAYTKLSKELKDAGLYDGERLILLPTGGKLMERVLGDDKNVTKAEANDAMTLGKNIIRLKMLRMGIAKAKK